MPIYYTPFNSYDGQWTVDDLPLVEIPVDVRDASGRAIAARLVQRAPRPERERTQHFTYADLKFETVAVGIDCPKDGEVATVYLRRS